MEPEVMQGSMLFCKGCEVEDVAIGGLYIFALSDKALLRKVGEADAEGFTLIGCDEKVAPVRIERSRIVRLYTIKAVLEWKNNNL
jgi:hypothetical protein